MEKSRKAPRRLCAAGIRAAIDAFIDRARSEAARGTRRAVSYAQPGGRGEANGLAVDVRRTRESRRTGRRPRERAGHASDVRSIAKRIRIRFALQNRNRRSAEEEEGAVEGLKIGRGEKWARDAERRRWSSGAGG
ncbi:hypothetical protein KM043_015272 [Ampulex compressa]|nr:hypothetical protein KM043_015272 [Ampulex compressa]